MVAIHSRRTPIESSFAPSPCHPYSDVEMEQLQSQRGGLHSKVKKTSSMPPVIVTTVLTRIIDGTPYSSFQRTIEEQNEHSCTSSRIYFSLYSVDVCDRMFALPMIARTRSADSAARSPTVALTKLGEDFQTLSWSSATSRRTLSIFTSTITS